MNEDSVNLEFFYASSEILLYLDLYFYKNLKINSLFVES